MFDSGPQDDECQGPISPQPPDLRGYFFSGSRGMPPTNSVSLKSLQIPSNNVFVFPALRSIAVNEENT